MAKLGSSFQDSTNGQPDALVSLCSLGLMLCIVFAVLGIKLRWFKKRINFDQIQTENSGSSDNGQVVLRSARNFQKQFSEPVVVQGIFRKKLDEDIIIERPKTLPPVRIRTSSKSLLDFGPPKRNEVPPTIVEEPVVIPPPPPPLPPSASASSLLTLGTPAAPHTSPPTEEKVNFAPSVEIIPNGDSEIETEPLATVETPINRQLSGRKQTGYARPSDEIIAELQKLSDEVTRNQNFEKKTPEPLPRLIIPDTSKFKKNTSRTVKSSPDSQEPEEEHIPVRKLAQRRLTGIFPSPDDNLGISDDDDEEDSDQKSSNKVVFKVVDDSDDERKSSSPPSIRSSPPVNKPSSVLFITQVSSDTEEEESSDSWSAIQRHRNLTQEISDQKETITPKEELYAVPKVEHPPATQPEEQYKPRTMRDMKRNNARNNLLLNSEKDYFEM